VKRSAFILMELVVSLVLLEMLLAGVSNAVAITGEFNRCQLVRQQCLSAAQAQLDSLAATGKAMDESVFVSVWPKLTSSVEQSDGEGDWAGLRKVSVTVTGVVSGGAQSREIRVTLCRYLPAGRGPS